jgi:hypothetical protein
MPEQEPNVPRRVSTSSLADSVMGLLNQQLGAGADAAGHFASSMRLAAHDMERENPMLADLVRGLAHNVDGYADALENQTVEQLTKTASDFTRRQPALVFGLAAVAGFPRISNIQERSIRPIAVAPA